MAYAGMLPYLCPSVIGGSHLADEPQESGVSRREKNKLKVVGASVRCVVFELQRGSEFLSRLVGTTEVRGCVGGGSSSLCSEGVLSLYRELEAPATLSVLFR